MQKFDPNATGNTALPPGLKLQDTLRFCDQILDENPLVYLAALSLAPGEFSSLNSYTEDPLYYADFYFPPTCVP